MDCYCVRFRIVTDVRQICAYTVDGITQESRMNMQKRIGGFFEGAFKAITSPGNRLMLAFVIEGFLFQFVVSVKTFGNNLFATNLGATDTQIGLIQTVGCAVTVALLLPVGIISDRCKSSKTVPVFLLLAGGAVFMLQSMVPAMGSARLTIFLMIVGMSSGLFGAYNSQWQSMFGDLVDIRGRNRIYATRSRVMAVMGVIVPVFCGVAMSGQTGSDGKLKVLSTFMFISGAMMIIQALVVMRIPGGRRSQAQMEAVEHFSPANLLETIAGAVKNRPFMAFVLASMLVYTSWQLDWSMWYIGQTQYAMMTEAQLSYYNAACAVIQIFALGMWAKSNQKRNVHFTVCICVSGAALYPVYAVLMTFIPVNIRPWAFICMCVTACMFECGIVMCLVQMMLEVVPEKHRSLTISLYTILTTLSNAIMPLVGVRLYTALGAGLGAFRLFFAIEFCYRAFVGAFFVRRYLSMKRHGKIMNYKSV